MTIHESTQLLGDGDVVLLADMLKQAEEDKATLREALKPFAEFASQMLPHEKDSHAVYQRSMGTHPDEPLGLTKGQFKAARDAVKKVGGGETA